jgi:large subunit ribosomal protein L19
MNKNNNISNNLINYVEQKYKKPNLELSIKTKNISTGNLAQIEYKIFEGNKERIQCYEGLIISMQNRGLSKTIKIRRIVQGIGVEQTFFLNSPKIISIIIKQKYKIRRSKLYFIRKFKGKSQSLKIIK